MHTQIRITAAICCGDGIHTINGVIKGVNIGNADFFATLRAPGCSQMEVVLGDGRSQKIKEGLRSVKRNASVVVTSPQRERWVQLVIEAGFDDIDVMPSKAGSIVGAKLGLIGIRVCNRLDRPVEDPLCAWSMEKLWMHSSELLLYIKTSGSIMKISMRKTECFLFCHFVLHNHLCQRCCERDTGRQDGDPITLFRANSIVEWERI